MVSNYDPHLISAQLRSKLVSLISHSPTLKNYRIPSSNQTFDVIVTPNEVNQRHGTGVLVSKIFSEDLDIFSIRSQNSYGGEQTFGRVSLCLPQRGLSRPEIFSIVLEAFGGNSARRVLCIPYFPDDVLTALAVAELFNAPLCVYIMDDQNVCSSGIPNDLMREVLSKASLRLAISPELQQAYEAKYNLKFWLLPPVLSGHLIQSQVRATSEKGDRSKVGVLIGNIWGQKWLDLLRQTIVGSGVQVHWYCNSGAKSPWLTFDLAELKKEGITIYDPLPEPELAVRLRDYAFAILPSGTLDERDDNRSVAQLSLPSRVPFILATSHTPTIVLGSPNTAAGKFVKRFQVGTVCDYDLSSFCHAVADVTAPETQHLMRHNAAGIASAFSSDGIAEWVWRSLEQGEPYDLKFEKLMPRSPSDLTPFIESPVPKELWGDFISVYQVMRRLRHQGLKPDFFIDVGASTGVWSHTVSQLFSDSRFILVDPLFSKYDDAAKNYYIHSHPNFEMVEAAVSNQLDRTVFQVSKDLYGSSLLHPSDFRSYEAIPVQVITLDYLVQEKRITGRGVLKIDVQCAEHLVLEGAHQSLSQIDVLVVELSLVRYDDRAKVLFEMCQLIHELGFRYYDDVGCWRSPVDGTLLQKDILFVRHDRFMPDISQN